MSRNHALNITVQPDEETAYGELDNQNATIDRAWDAGVDIAVSLYAATNDEVANAKSAEEIAEILQNLLKDLPFDIAVTVAKTDVG